MIAGGTHDFYAQRDGSIFRPFILTQTAKIVVIKVDRRIKSSLGSDKSLSVQASSNESKNGRHVK